MAVVFDTFRSFRDELLRKKSSIRNYNTKQIAVPLFLSIEFIKIRKKRGESPPTY